jgi:hypothetical protein
MTLPPPPLRTALAEAPPSPPRAEPSGLRTALRVAGLAGLALLAGGCRQEPAPPQVLPTGALPVGAPSGQPRFFADGEALGLSWVEREGDVAALRFALREGGRWSRPVEAARGTDWFVNWADTPGVVALGGGAYAAFYLQRTGEGTYDYAIRVVRSEDGGASWGPPVTPHREDVASEFGFVSALPEGEGVRLVWLDGAAMGGGHGGHGGGGAMALRTAVLGPGGEVSAAALLDDRTCECCSTALAQTGEGLLVAYRDRSEGEVRDVGLVRQEGEGWSPPSVPHPDGWRIDGCPVNGPALAARSDRVALAWYTGAEGSRVQVALSADAGRTFGPPLRVDGGEPIGRVDLAWAGGQAVVGWMEREGEAAALLVQVVGPEGAAGTPYRMVSLPAERASGMPRLAVHADTLWAAWVEASGVRVAAVPLAEVARQ